MTVATTEYETIRVETAGPVATITLDRPDVYNAFNDQLSFELQRALKDAARQKTCRVVVITGAGKAFSSGQDLGELKERYTPGYVPNLSQDLRKRYNPIVTQITTMPKPVIAAVNGVAAGAGASLALACDLRIASEYASFVWAFVNVGLIPDSGSTYFLPRLIGHARAMEVCTTGRKVKAEEAARLGLVNEVVPVAELASRTQALAEQLAAMPAQAIAFTKRLFHGGSNRTLAEQLEAEAYIQETAGRTEDHGEGVRAFLEKRPAQFKGC